ncbi:MAG: glycosyltransferase family 4 protein [Deltaproteobacteria bacterium]|nr:MAG: glycosyltransferase family 4 protein [Deltaproteobacteria bacterium]
MRIAQVSPLYESVPPKLYGGTERVVSYLTEALVEMGHEVYLFASGDSETKAHLIPVEEKALRLGGQVRDSIAPHVTMAEKVAKMADEFDVIHNHIDYLLFPIARRIKTPVITTLHGRLDLPETVKVFTEFREMPLVSISDAQRTPLPHCNWVGTVYHGLPEDLYRPGDGKGGYLAFIGRISPEKRVDSAIRIATKAGIPLKIAAKVDPADREYYERVIKPLLNNPLVEYIGEIGEGEKEKFLGDAIALLFPVDWPEPFGLAMIEAMACGTPVLARRRGSVPEVVDEGVTGFIFEEEEEAVPLLEKTLTLPREAVRKRFEERFTARRMAEEYHHLYLSLTFLEKAA